MRTTNRSKPKRKDTGRRRTDSTLSNSTNLEAGSKYLIDLRVELVPPSSLKLYEHNPRIHSPRQIRQIADSIHRFGFTNPILVDAEGGVVAGHGRVTAAKLLGMESVPTIRLDQMSEQEKRVYVLVDNNGSQQTADLSPVHLDNEYARQMRTFSAIREGIMAISAVAGPDSQSKMPWPLWGFCGNSLLSGTGNYFGRTKELSRRNREFDLESNESRDKPCACP